MPVIEVYGMTETSSVHTLSYPRPAGAPRARSAMPVPYSRVRVVEVDAREAASATARSTRSAWWR